MKNLLVIKSTHKKATQTKGLCKQLIEKKKQYLK